jgi:hypothetical protein
MGRDAEHLVFRCCRLAGLALRSDFILGPSFIVPGGRLRRIGLDPALTSGAWRRRWCRHPNSPDVHHGSLARPKIGNQTVVAALRHTAGAPLRAEVR